MDACRAAGLSPVICSAYRSYEKQEELYRNKVDRLLAQGYAQTDAEEEAGREVARPGTSEHQLGLAVDIVDLDNQNLDETQEDNRRPAVAHGPQLGVRVHPPLPRRQERDHRDHLRALALPLRGAGRRGGDL